MDQVLKELKARAYDIIVKMDQSLLIRENLKKELSEVNSLIIKREEDLYNEQNKTDLQKKSPKK